MSGPPLFRYSFANLLTVAAATSEDADYPASNLLHPERPFMPWKSTSTAEQTLTLTLSGAVSLVILVGANFTQATLNGNAITIGRSPFNRRYQYGTAILPAVASLPLVIPSQTPTDGGTKFRLGGIWAGASVVPPMNPRFNVEHTTLTPILDLQPEHQGWRERLFMGDPIVNLRVSRVARTTRLTPALNDHLRRWADIDRQVMEADYFGLFLNAGDSSQAYVVRVREPEITWQRARLKLSESEYDLEEVIR